MPDFRPGGSNHLHDRAVKYGAMAMALRPETTATAQDPSAPALTVVESDLVRAANGDRDAFERVYRAHVGRVYSICLRMIGDRTEAEEATQDVFVRLWSKVSLYRGESRFTTWLHRLAVNVVLTRRKAESRHTDRAAWGEMLEMVPQQELPVGLSMDLEAAIGALPEGARRVFILHDVEGYKHEEIGSMLGITSGGSKAQLHRARLLLRKVLNR